MQQKDYVLIGVTAVFSLIMSFVLSGIFISPSSERTQTAEVVEAFIDDFSPAPDQYFNSESINPTQLIQVKSGSPDGSVPFGER